MWIMNNHYVYGKEIGKFVKDVTLKEILNELKIHLQGAAIFFFF